MGKVLQTAGGKHCHAPVDLQWESETNFFQLVMALAVPILIMMLFKDYSTQHGEKNHYKMLPLPATANKADRYI